jgi:antitoxin VapB
MIRSTVEGRIEVVPTLNIKDPEVYRLAAELAELRHTTMTAAIREALQAAIAADQGRREGRLERLNEIALRSAEKIRLEGIQILTDDDLYDEWGLPK